MVYLLLFTWNHIILWKLFVLRIVTWSYNGLLIIIIYLKPYKKKKKSRRDGLLSVSAR